MNRLVNYTLGLILIYLFILEGRAEDHGMIILGLVLSTLVAYLAFFSNWITLDATKSVIVLGTITLGLGGWWVALAMLFFFVSSSMLTRFRNRVAGIDPEKRNIHHDLQSRRDGYQVWANGFWVAFFLLGWFLTNLEAALMAAFAVLASAAADTWATEMGSVKPGKTRKITNFEVVKPGTDGGISLKGTLASLVGSFTVALFVIPVFEQPSAFVAIVFISGFLGAVADSYVGCYLQKEEARDAVPTDYFHNQNTFKNSLVNWLSTGIGGFLAFIIVNIYLI